MHWAHTMPTREKQGEALTESNVAFDAGTDFGYRFRETATGALLGGGGAHRGVGPGAVEIAYWVRSDRHNRGHAPRAAEATTDAAFTYLSDVDWVEIHMDCTNPASARVTGEARLPIPAHRTAGKARSRPHRRGLRLAEVSR
jgi:RimJ/RimL family protein N-acetyltransferase